MAATGATPISLYYSSTTTNVPTAGNLVAGELALNTADGKLFYKDSSNVVQVIGTKGGVGTSSTTQVLYNSSGLVVGSANLTFNGTTLTTANDASISGLTVGKGSGAVVGNTVVGNLAVNGNSGVSSGGGTSAFGAAALYNLTTGVSNTAVGYQAALGTTSGGYNTVIGSQALFSNTTASNNTAVGYQAGYASNATQLTAFGYYAGLGNTTGNYNVYLGSQSGQNATTGSSNTFIGQGSGFSMTTGSKNTILGAYNGNQGGLDIRTASNYIVLSDGDGNPLAFTANGNTFALQGGTSNSGTGIAFPATQSASSNANTLDDYEEGTWTPTNAQGISMTLVSGTYEKIGRLVTARARLKVGINSNANAVIFSGLPFTVSNTNTGAGGFIAYSDSGLAVTLYVDQQNISFYTLAGGQPLFSAYSAKEVQFTVVYSV